MLYRFILFRHVLRASFRQNQYLTVNRQYASYTVLYLPSPTARTSIALQQGNLFYVALSVIVPDAPICHYRSTVPIQQSFLSSSRTVLYYDIYGASIYVGICLKVDKIPAGRIVG